MLSAPTAAAYDASVVAPVTSLSNEGFYYIYDANADDGSATEVDASINCRYAFRFDSGNNEAYTADIYGTHIKPINITDQLENKHVWQALEGSDNTWQFKNVATGRYLAQESAQSTSNESDYGSFDLEPVSGKDGVFKVKIHGTGYRWDGNGGGNNPMVYWEGAGHDIHFYEAVANTDGYELARYDGWNVTYNYAFCDGTVKSQVLQLADGANASGSISNLQFNAFFTPTDLAESNTTVGEGNVTFNIQGTWNFPMVFNNTYRVRCKPSTNGNSVVTYNTANGTVTTNTGNGTELEANRFWFFKLVRYNENGYPVMTMHTLADTERGLLFEDNNDGNSPTLSETPTELTLTATIWGNKQPGDFVFSFGENNGNFTNDRSGYFSSWKSSAGTNDASVIRLSSLTEEDYTKFSYVASAEDINAAKANPTPESILALLDAYNQNPLIIAIANAKEYPIGQGLGQFNNEACNFETLLANAEALANNDNATEEEINNALASIAVNTLRINQPKANHYYRFHYGNAYMSTEVNSDSRFTIVSESNADNLNNTTVFFFDGTHLVTFPEGLVMGNLDTNNKDKAYKGVLSTSAYAGAVTFEASTVTKGDYNIKLGSRYLYHAAAQIDAGNGTDSSEGYRWNITEVTWLPIPHDGTDYFTVFSPVELGLGYNGDNRVTPYYGTIQGNTFGKYDTETSAIPANTPVLLKYVQGLSNGCVYLPVNYPTDAAAAQADETTDEPAADTKVSDLKGGFLATDKEEGKNYFTAQGNKFGAHEGDYIPGFSAYLTVDTESANAEGYTIGDFVTDSISEIENADDAAVTEIYDLQGRRVSKAGRGIFIVNGKKVLIK